MIARRDDTDGHWFTRLRRGLLCAGAVSLLTAALPVTALAQDGPDLLIDTVAGTGDTGYNGDDIPATTAQLNNPGDVEIDPADGSLYVADNDNNRVRRVDPDTGLITTVAGTGVAGYNGDGIPATTAQLDGADAIALDSDGALYIADLENHRVRRVDPDTGLITTVAGTGVAGYNGDGIPATTAQLNVPEGVAVDADGAVYIGDTLNHRIRHVDPNTGLITTVAGTGVAGYNGDGIPATTAQIFSPEGVAVDADGNLYIADSLNERVRRVDADTGLITTVAGTGVAGYNGDGIPATTAQLSQPEGVAVDADGNLYIADSDNERVRRVDADTGLITTVAGTGVAGYNGDGIPATSAHLDYPAELRVDVDGTLLIADNENSRIRAVGPAPGQPDDTETTSGVPVTIAAPDGTVFTDVDDPDPGAAELAGDGSSITYTPPPNFDGDVPVDYTIRTTARWPMTTTGTVTVAVSSPPAPTIAEPREGQTLDDPRPAFSGTAEPDSRVVVRDQDGNRLCTATAGEDGSWSCRATQDLPNGTYQVTATSTDAFGNTGNSNVRQFTISITNDNSGGGGSNGGGQPHRAALARTGASWISTIPTALILIAGSASLLAWIRRRS